MIHCTVELQRLQTPSKSTIAWLSWRVIGSIGVCIWAFIHAACLVQRKRQQQLVQSSGLGGLACDQLVQRGFDALESIVYLINFFLQRDHQLA